ncbi:hypothetical protein HPB52_001601 [Rhipicephalus sanguineus]|uniref:Nlr family card domain protein n=1 Tax=Rhipicephalus sanguineus TaxID=34632 RepID=A0A9D4SQH5_RHISA|nr:hypothetical protein HPB52_001601 [Rhipicephalus sanguineus]
MAGASAVLARSSFSTDDYGACLEAILLKCTRGQTRVCHLLSYLTDFNAALWNIGLQLREDDDRKQPGNLVVVTVPGTCAEFPLCDVCAHNEELAVSYLRCLLRVHRCIFSAEMNCGVANSAMVIEALASSSSLRRLTVRGTELQDEREARLRGPVSVGHLASGYVYPNDSLATPVISLLLQRDSDTALTSLDVAELAMTPSGVDMLITALMENETVAELVVGYDVFARRPRDDPYAFPFERYLKKKNATLKKLALKTSIPLFCISHMRALAQAISSISTLEELHAQWPSTPQLCAVFATAVFQSRSLRSVRLLLRDVGYGTVVFTASDESGRPTLQSWPSVLRHNRVLRNLDLDVSWCLTEHCLRLLNALALNRGSLQTVSLRNLLDEGCLKAVCETIRNRGLGDRVCINDHLVAFGHAPILPLCPEVTAVTVSSRYLSQIVRVLRNVFKALATCHHVTSLQLLLHSSTSRTFRLLATYIRGASTLKEIKLRIYTGSIHEPDDEEVAMDVGDVDASVTQALQLLYKALCSNLYITKLHLFSRITLSEDDCRMFAEYATLNNGRLYELSMKHVSFPGHFARRLVPPFRRNYSLLFLEVPVCLKPDPDMYGAQDVVRRNCGLVESATKFVMGERDRYGASALEFVSEHPKLVENVRREAALPGDAEARNKITDVSRLLRRIDMHEFMRMTGVVERQVVCDYREQDDDTQFDKLNFYCWTHIRQYLKLRDVVLDWDLV